MSSSADEIDWARFLERLLYAFPPVVGVGLVGVLQETEPGVPGLERLLVVFGVFGYTALTLGLTVALVLDARRVRRRPKAGGHWEPNPWLNAVFALVLAPAAGVIYLARRHRHFGTPPPGWSGWWLVVGISLATTVTGITAAAIAVVLAIPGLLTAGIALAGAVAFGLFPVAIYRDAAYVCVHGNSWRPNPGLYLGVAFASLFVPPLQPIVAGYYLLRRRDTVGTP